MRACKPGYLVLLSACVVFLLFSCYALYLETGAFLFSLKSDQEVSITAGQEVLDIPFSTFSKTLVLERCIASTRSLQGRLQPKKQKEAHFLGCRDVSVRTAMEHPSSSLAWYGAAALEGELKDKVAFQKYFELSYRSSPREDWLSKRRFKLFLRHRDYQTAEIEKIFHSDIETILNSYEGAQWMADRYVQHPNLRSVIMEKAKQANLIYQKVYLKHLKKKL